MIISDDNLKGSNMSEATIEKKIQDKGLEAGGFTSTKELNISIVQRLNAVSHIAFWPTIVTLIDAPAARAQKK